MKKLTLILALILTATLMIGCGTTPPIVLDNPPVITSTEITNAEIGVAYTYPVIANDPDGDALTYSLTRNPSGMVIDEDGVISWTPDKAGSFGVTVKVSDGALSDTQSFTILITPISLFTGITVDPLSMDLEVGQTETFVVTANYSDGTDADMTLVCDYTQPTTGIANVTGGEVEAIKAGTDTIQISYTEDGVTDTANISVTVGTIPIPMVLTADVPIFTTGEPRWFTVKMVANDDAGKLAVMSLPVGGETMDNLEVQEGSTLTFDGEIFTVQNATANIRGTFLFPGNYTITMEIKESPSNVVLCSQSIVLVVTGESALKIGTSYGGGKVAYLDGTGLHGLIAATADQSAGIAWSNITSGVSGATGTALGTGQANTLTIMAQSGHTSSAAKLCADYSITVDEVTYDDWFLPSKDELIKLFTNKVVIGGFGGVQYWSSSEDEYRYVWVHEFSDEGYVSTKDKFEIYNVRAVRAF